MHWKNYYFCSGSLRRLLFWKLDSLKGGEIKRYYNEVKLILENPIAPESLAIQRRYTKELLNYAVFSTAFYKKYQNFNSLNDFPVIDKNIILDNYESFISSSFKRSKLYPSTSSGSTGIPFTILQNDNKRRRNTADVIVFAELGDIFFGEKLVYIKLWDKYNRKNSVVRFLQNIWLYDVMDSDKRLISNFLKKLALNNSKKSIMGYPSFLMELCNFLEKENSKNWKFKIDSIITISETLPEYLRKKLENNFTTRIFERYSNQENGIIAQQTHKDPTNFTINWASYHIEILELHNDCHVKSGELGRIVITDFFNYAMPMIRYDTGDLGVYQIKGNGIPVLQEIYGRRMDIIHDTKGNMVSPFIFYRVLDFSKAKQFQFIQKGANHYIFKLNSKKIETDEKGIKTFFKKYLGSNAVIDFKYVDEVPLLASGKRKKISNEYLNSREY